MGSCYEGFARVEIGAGGAKTNLGPPANEVDLSAAHEDMAAQADQPGGKTAVVATDMIRIAYVAKCIAYCRFYIIRHRFIKPRHKAKGRRHKNLATESTEATEKKLMPP